MTLMFRLLGRFKEKAKTRQLVEKGLSGLKGAAVELLYWEGPAWLAGSSSASLP